MSDPLIIKRCMAVLQSKYILTEDEAKGMTEIVIATAKALWEDPPRSNLEADAQAKFTEYFVKNYPGPDTVIFDPKWHAPKIFRAAVSAIQSSTLNAKTQGLRGAASA